MDSHSVHLPFASQKSTGAFVAIDVISELDCGQYVRAMELSNMDYKIRFEKLENKNNMNAPPVCESLSSGYLVIGKPGTRKQFEDWIPNHQFNKLYEKISPEYVDYFPFPTTY